jgi:hypothetical protein
MSYLDDYIVRINVTGNSIAEAQTNATVLSINAAFNDSPWYKLVTIDGVEKDAQIQDMQSVVRSNTLMTILTTNKFILLKPYESANLGSIVEYDNYTYIVTDFIVDNPLFPKGKIEQCNTTIDIITSTTETVTGTDSMGRPIVEKTPVPTTLPCLFVGNLTSSSMNNEINQPRDTVKFTVQYNNTSKLIKEGDNYTFYDRSYKVKSIDHTNIYNGVGLIQVLADRDVV